MAKEIKYYEEDKDSKGKTCCVSDNKYSKWNVDEAYRSILDAKKALEDPKMKKYVVMCAEVKAAEAVAAAKEAGMVAKVGSKLKEMYKNA